MSNTKAEYSNKQPIRNLFVLSVVSWGLYDFYWFYRNWKYFGSSAPLKTLLLLVPIVNIFMIYDNFKVVASKIKEEGLNIRYAPGAMTFVYIFVYVVFIHLPDPWWLLSVANVYPLLKVQKNINEYWDYKQKGLPERTHFNWKEWIVIVIGGVFWLSVLLAMFIV